MLRLLISLVFILIFSSQFVYAKDYLFKTNKGLFKVNLNNLKVSFKQNNQLDWVLLSNKINKNLGNITDFKSKSDQASWHYTKSALSIVLKKDNHGLIFEIKNYKNLTESFNWPVINQKIQAKALMVPNGAGVYIPRNDSFWLKNLKTYPSLTLYLPFIGAEFNHFNVNYLFINELRLNNKINTDDNKVNLMFENQLIPDQKPIKIIFHITDQSTISPAIDYKNWLIKHGNYKTLNEKAINNPNIKKLYGAFHIWLWGNGKSLELINDFHQAGIDKLWLGYDSTKTKNDNVSQKMIEQAEDYGYLIGPYDSFYNAQNPKTADSISSIWQHHLYPDGCIIQKNGQILKGFGNRGCYLSSESLEKNENLQHNIKNRVDLLTKNGDNSYFLDVDATWPFYDDFSLKHPMTMQKDLNNRIQRLNYLSNIRQLVVGSETALPWFNTVISFDNGSFLTFDDAFWSILSNQQFFGGWWPDDQPKVFFKPVNLPQSFIDLAYNPKYRIPLYEAVFHGSIISTDRWELNFLKAPNLEKIKALFEFLYNVPSIWVLNQTTWNQHKSLFINYYKSASPILKIGQSLPLSSFKWLTKDHLVQEIIYGNQLKIIANFSDKSYQDIKAQSAIAYDLNHQKSYLFQL